MTLVLSRKRTPDLSFKAGLVASWCVGGSAERLWRRGFGKDPVLKSTPLRDVSYGTLFAYMYRRFGVPPLPGDDYKDLCGGWMLSTPSSSLVVLVRPSLSSPERCFSPILLREQGMPKYSDPSELGLSDGQVQDLANAYRTLLIDLLRPVCVRDKIINALGMVDHGHPLARSNSDGEHLFEVDWHASAGYGFPMGLVGCKDWSVLCQLMRQAGDGDAAKGAAELVRRAREQILAGMSGESQNIKRLVIAGVGDDAPWVGGGMGLMQWEIDEATQWAECLGAGDIDLDRQLSQCSPDEVSSAADWLSRLAYDSSMFFHQVRMVLVNASVKAAWDDLVASSGGQFPDDALESAELVGANPAALLRERLTASGHDDLVGWVDRTLALREGEAALSTITCHLQELCLQRRPIVEDVLN